MPRDDLSIDFVKKTMPPVEAVDPVLILDEWISRTQNLPEEIRHLQEEIAEKDKLYDKYIREIDDLDGRIQKFIKVNGSHAENPKEAEYRAVVYKNFEAAERLANEKIALSRKMQMTMDKHVRILDMQIKLLFDRNEPGFQDPDELPSLIRPSAANLAVTTPAPRPLPTTTATLAPVAATGAQLPVRAAHLQLMTNVQTLQHASSAPATPAASMIMNRQVRESSAGPGSGAPKRGPRSNAGPSNLPAMSSALARHSSLGPGNTTKSQQTVEGAQRAGSVGPRSAGRPTGPGRKTGGPGAGRKKSMPGGVASGPKSGLSRVKRAAKNSPPSAADSEASEAETGTGDDSDAHTGGLRTPAARASSHPHVNHKESSHEPGPRGGSQGHRAGGPGGSGVRAGRPRAGESDEDAMDVEDDEGSDDKKYCICQNVSFGDMVACDNDDCPFEWFHWTCVDLKSEPNGKWFCPMCTEEKKKKGLKA